MNHLLNNKYLSKDELVADHDESRFHDDKELSSFHGSMYPFSIKSDHHRSHHVPKHQDIIGFYFNQHLEFGNDSTYNGDSSCFIFKYIDHHHIKAYKPVAGKSKYFKVTSQGIFIGNFYEK
jgi:hypothetical protein